MQPYTVALTSCGRFDLLERTLASLLPRLEGPLAKVLIIEDSGDRSVYDVLRQFGGGPDIEAIFNDPPIGQIRSIDRLYAQVETDWIFHCEDDWEFFGDGFVAASFAILQELPKCSMVNLRDPAELGDSDHFAPEAVTSSGVRYILVSMNSSWKFGGLQFNPGLRRMRDYRIVGPYADFRGEGPRSACVGVLQGSRIPGGHSCPTGRAAHRRRSPCTRSGVEPVRARPAQAFDG